jgi:amino acid adenylation domain-containing protein
VTARALAAPEAIAIVGDGLRMSYGALEAGSNRLARLLAAAGCRRGDRVAILMPKQPAAIVAMIAALKAGAAYVPLDPSEPAARLARMLAVADCRCVLATAPAGAALRDALAAAQLRHPPAIGWLDEDTDADDGLEVAFRPRDLLAFVAEPAPAAGDPADVAHILFTSGSTGLPKGVMITHASVLAFLRWAGRHFGAGRGDRIAQHAPLRFDLSTFDVFGALRSGAELHLVPPELNLQPGRLAGFLRDSGITRWLAVPSTLGLMARFDVIAPGDFPALRDLMFAGEVLPVPTLEHWMRRLPHVRFTNLYGPTETTIASSHYTVPACPDAGAEPIPIGTPCDGEDLWILDSRRRPVPDGRTGDIYVSGAGLSPGYWRDPVRTRRSFLDGRDARGRPLRIYRTGDRGWRDADGLFHFAGRADSQVKCRGYRIELGEIERALHALPIVRHCAVVAIPSSGFEGSLICCAYVPAEGADGSPLALRSALAGRLPAYMLPARWKRWRELPLNPNGKCDRRRLQQEFQQAEATPARAAPGRTRPAAPPARRRARRRSRP